MVRYRTYDWKLWTRIKHYNINGWTNDRTIEWTFTLHPVAAFINTHHMQWRRETFLNCNSQNRFNAIYFDETKMTIFPRLSFQFVSVSMKKRNNLPNLMLYFHTTVCTLTMNQINQLKIHLIVSSHKFIFLSLILYSSRSIFSPVYFELFSPSQKKL